MTAIEWFVGSNGNQFADAGRYRYCIAFDRNRDTDGFYTVYCNGVELARDFLTQAEARHFIEAQAAFLPATRTRSTSSII